jgi:hypothetical protein
VGDKVQLAIRSCDVGRWSAGERRHMAAEDVIRARRFELVDDRGNVRTVLTAEPGETGTDLIGIHIANNQGRPVVSIGVDPEHNVPFLTLRDKAGSEAAVFATVMPDGTAALTLRDKEGREEVKTA